MSIKDDEKPNTQSAKVLQLGFNISVSGDPGTDFQILLDDTAQKALPSTLQSDARPPSLGISPRKYSETESSKKELENETEEVESIENKSIKLHSKDTSPKVKDQFDSSSGKESNIIHEIKSTLKHFEKFSDHLKDVPRLRGHPAATSTPLSDKNNSKSESNLLYSEFRTKRFPHLYDYHYKKNYYFNKPSKPPDLFLKPLPGENLYRSGFYTKYTTDSLRHYVSDNSLNKTSDPKVVCEKSKYDDFTLDTPGILKKPDSENVDKQSTSSAESIKDIKIYQSGGILIMQNFKENMDAMEKKEISDFSAKLIENCSRLREEVNSFQEGSTKGVGFSSEEGRNPGKMVQFDLPGFENQKSKSRDSSFSASKDEKRPLKQGSSDSVSDSAKNKESSPLGTSQSQDFPSLSTVENESTISNQFGVSPTYSSTKKLEWDSGADVGYQNSDLSKENLSTIEKYVLSHLSSGTFTNSEPEFSKFTKVRVASDKLMDEIREQRRKEQQEIMIIEERKSCEHEVEVVELSDDEPVNNVKVGTLKESKPVNEVLTEKHPKSKAKAVESTDKIVSVNTLFKNANLTTSHRNITSEDFRKVEISNRKSPKVRKFRKSKPSPRKITWAPQKRRFSLENMRSGYESPAFEMGAPKKTYKKVSRNPEIRDLELSREIGEIVIDQSFKIKQNLSSGKEVKKATAGAVEKESKFKRPVSGSSSSNNTVLPNIENKDAEKRETLNMNKVSDQIIQTVDLDCESVGVQAFESQKSSNCSSKIVEEQPNAPGKAGNVHLSSKNIQAFGLNASLPKELAHLRDTNFFENQHTKSTQFFGGPINSLPNYHSSLVTKPGESCSRVPKILNTKKTAEAEIIRLNEENKRNILANDSKRTNSKSSNAKNKENFYSKNSRKSHSSAPQKTRGSPEKKDSEGSDLKSEKHSSLVENPDSVHTSDEISSKILTSEVLKEHGDSIDRNIIQEKYFQSQLIELKKREMISRSTSVDLEIEGGRAEKECATVGCQYSSRSRDTTSEEESKDQVPEEKSKQKSQRTETTDQYDSSPNVMEEEVICTSKSTNQGQVTGDSLPSSTQTAHSWIPGVQNPEQDKSGVGRARSFEYLPGHIYENSGNLRKELPIQTEQNIMTSSSSESDSGKRSSNEGGKDSEGRNTLILENSTDDSHDSDQLKILDENLTQLNVIVSKLWEKEAEVKKLNQSLFLNLRHKNGSGDHLDNVDTLQTELVKRKNTGEHRKESGDSTCDLSARVEKKAKEISTGCQTEEKSSSDPENFYQERKTLEKRISEEKRNQIKWIENEIHHLNILRRLLERQSVSQQTKKRPSLASESPNDISKTETDRPNSNLNGNYSVPVTPVYGCTISLSRNSPPVENRPTSEGSSAENQEHVNAINSDPIHYGMSVSLRNVAMDAIQSFQRVVTLPVGVQISLKGSGSGREGSNSGEENENVEKTSPKSRPVSSDGNSLPQERRPCRRCRVSQNEACTQFPSSRKDSLNFPSTSAQTDFSSRKCNRCQRQNCFCLSLSGGSLQSTSHSSKVSERRESLRCSGNEELAVEEDKTSSSTVRELLELESDPNPKSDKTAKVLITSNGKSGSSGSFSKSKCMHKNECKKHPERGHSSPVKSGVQGICRNPCLSNGTSISDKSEDFPSCHCSKVHIQKFSTCSCHIIKIMDTKCSTESGTCRCKKRTSKTTENQSCQTDQVTIVTKDLVETPQLIKASRAQGVDNLSEKKIAYEKKTSVVQKLSNDERIVLDKRRSCDKKLEVQEKVGVVKRSPEVDTHVKEKSLQAVRVNCSRRGAEKEEVEIDEADTDRTCTCWEQFKKKTTDDNCMERLPKEMAEENYCIDALREVGSEDDHPRHYFLKIEETEVDDSKESLEMKNSLEVITVKIPVKKAGKGKIYNPKCPKTYQTDQYGMNSRKEVPKGCNCCQGCRGYREKPTEYSTSDECRVQAEKPQSPVRFCEPHPTPVTSLDDMRYQYMYDKYQPCEKRYSSIRGECYCDRSVNFQNNASKRDIHTEYDSHKKYRCNSKSNSESTSYENGRSQIRQEKTQSKQWCEGNEIPVNNQERKSKSQGGHRCGDEDYFNYDRTEYKTKSELLKEEEEERKTHQPSLQEYLCRNRPDFYNTAERRRQIITEKARERTVKHNNRMECLMSLIHCCNEGAGEKRIFTTSEMREQTMKRYKKLPEVTGKIADQKKKNEYRTNKLVADIYSKKLQIEALKGHLNLSNSISVLATM